MSTWTDAVARLRSGVGYEAWAADTGRYDATRADYADWLADSARRETPGTALPRVWVLPTIPADVKAVADRDRIVWERPPHFNVWRIRHDAGTGPRYDDVDLLRRGPLTEVVS